VEDTKIKEKAKLRNEEAETRVVSRDGKIPKLKKNLDKEMEI